MHDYRNRISTNNDENHINLMMELAMTGMMLFAVMMVLAMTGMMLLRWWWCDGGGHDSDGDDQSSTTSKDNCICAYIYIYTYYVWYYVCELVYKEIDRILKLSILSISPFYYPPRPAHRVFTMCGRPPLERHLLLEVCEAFQSCKGFDKVGARVIRSYKGFDKVGARVFQSCEGIDKGGEYT